MIDGIKATYLTPTPAAPLPAADWYLTIREQTGELVDDVRRCQIAGIKAALKPTATGCHALSLSGSLHKYHNDGTHNADQFSAAAVGRAAGALCASLNIPPTETTLHGLEIGVNISLTGKPSEILNKAVCFKGRPFAALNPKLPALGLVCALWAYELKIYDKGAQSGQPTAGNLLRVELKVKKMRHLARFAIYTLADLQDPEKLRPLLTLLLEALAGIVWSGGTPPAGIAPKDAAKYYKLTNPLSWQEMNYERERYARETLAGLLEKHQLTTPAEALQKALSATWQSLFPAPVINPVKQQKFPALHRLYGVGKTGTNKPTPQPRRRCRIRKRPRIFISTLPAPDCITCGRSLAGQAARSKFCSARTVGTQSAHRCRNADSNRRRSLRTSIKKAYNMQNLISVSYTTGPGGPVYTDTFHPSELTTIPRQWLDRITAVKVLPTCWQEVPESYTGEAARLFAERLQAPETTPPTPQPRRPANFPRYSEGIPAPVQHMRHPTR